MYKVLILQDVVSQYRFPIFNQLAKQVDLTVVYLEPKGLKPEDVEFKFTTLKHYKIKDYCYVPKLRKYCNQFDVVLYMPHFRLLSYFCIPLRHNKFKTIAWTNGTRASYVQKFDLERPLKWIDKLYYKNLRKADAVVVYIEEVLDVLKRYGIQKEKSFCAHNSVEVEYLERKEKNINSILFVGTLYKDKGVDELIDCYNKAFGNAEDAPIMDIVGKGEESEKLKEQAHTLGLDDKIIFHGPIYDKSKLAEFFAKALVCVSPNQAGLSVLTSLGSGVPFVTKENAITGGEIVNVKNGYNGILYKEPQDLIDIFKELKTNKEKYIELGKNAREFYETKASPKHMVRGFVNAINFVMKK